MSDKNLFGMIHRLQRIWKRRCIHVYYTVRLIPNLELRYGKKNFSS